jgi:hypothetical protein
VVIEDPKVYGHATINVLQDLWGLPWNEVTKNYLVALRPSEVRESWGAIKLDTRGWRVTVYLCGEKEFPYIKSIEQEVKVGLEGGMANAYELEKKIHSYERYDE